jgi:hypothetical protein
MGEQKMKLCRGCATEKPEEDFYYGMNFCKPCHGKRTNDRAREREGLPQERTLVKLNTKLQQPNDGKRLCRKCNVRKPIEDFPQNGASGLLKSKCRACFNEWQSEFRKNNPDKRLAYRLKSQYNLGLETYREMETDANALGCPACGRPIPTRRGWNIDHDHDCCPGEKCCGKCIRGLLCAKCNTALGDVNDSIEHLQKLITYLQKFPKNWFLTKPFSSNTIKCEEK